jgi:ABC-type polysaccharide/polyol phosphate transport system ATPase subunit
MSNDCVIQLENVSKRLSIGSKLNQSLLSALLSSFSGIESKRSFWPIKNISFKVKRGDRLGIIGRNGSGKSTLLRVISGIYKADKGEKHTKGTMQLLTNLSNGLKPKLTVKDNVFLVGAILGLDYKNIERTFNEIIEFAGLEDFVYSKLYQLSNGMKQRLAFSITSHCVEIIDPDILLLDEVFAGGGGDEEFKERSTEKLESIMRSERTLVIVSHTMPFLQQMSERVIWLHKGEIQGHGRPEEVISEYLDFVKKQRNAKNKKNKTGMNIRSN